MTPPEDFSGLLDEIEKIQAVARERVAMMPPTEAKKMVHELLNEAEPMVGELRELVPQALAECEKFKEECEAKIAEAQANLAKTQETAANIKPRAEILKSLTPVAAALPAGLSLQFGQELQERYMPAPADVDQDDLPGTAWQDWTVS